MLTWVRQLCESCDSDLARTVIYYAVALAREHPSSADSASRMPSTHVSLLCCIPGHSPRPASSRRTVCTDHNAPRSIRIARNLVHVALARLVPTAWTAFAFQSVTRRYARDSFRCEHKKALFNSQLPLQAGQVTLLLLLVT